MSFVNNILYMRIFLVWKHAFTLYIFSAFTETIIIYLKKMPQMYFAFVLL